MAIASCQRFEDGYLQATGSAADELRSLAPVGSTVEVSSQLTGEDGRALNPSASTYVLNGGPELVDDGGVQVTPRTVGMVHPGEPSFDYAWHTSATHEPWPAWTALGGSSWPPSTGAPPPAWAPR